MTELCCYDSPLLILRTEKPPLCTSHTREVKWEAGLRNSPCVLHQHNPAILLWLFYGRCYDDKLPMLHTHFLWLCAVLDTQDSAAERSIDVTTESKCRFLPSIRHQHILVCTFISLIDQSTWWSKWSGTLFCIRSYTGVHMWNIFCSKAQQQRIYFLRRLGSFGANKPGVVFPIYNTQGCLAVWNRCTVTVSLSARLGRPLPRLCTKIVGVKSLSQVFWGFFSSCVF